MLQWTPRRVHTAGFRTVPTRALSRTQAFAATLLLVGLGLGGCAQQPQQVAAAGHSKEYFPSSVYGRASRRVVEDGQPIPRGGGQYLVGKPYTIAGQTYYPSERRITQVGLASWYGDAFHGRLTANGEIYDRDSFTAAHPTMPLPSYARVTNLRNNTSMIVRVNDRGPYHSNRVMDVSRRVADALDIRRTGTARVKVEWVARASLAGSDDAKLAATLRTDGPARADAIEEGIQVATAPARAIVASLGAFAPAPVPPRPARYVEQERPEALESYRSPRAAAPRPRHEETAQDEQERGERRAVSHPRPRSIEAEDDVRETGSLQRRSEHGHVAHADRSETMHRDLHRDEDRAGRKETARRDVRRDEDGRIGDSHHRTDDRRMERAGDRRLEQSDEARRGRQIAQRAPLDRPNNGHDMRQAATPMPPLRHAAGSMLPPARSVHVAALAKEALVQKRAVAPRRPHGD